MNILEKKAYDKRVDELCASGVIEPVNYKGRKYELSPEKFAARRLYQRMSYHRSRSYTHQRPVKVRRTPEEIKARKNRTNKEWRERNPAAHKESQRKAQKKYRSTPAGRARRILAKRCQRARRQCRDKGWMSGSKYLRLPKGVTIVQYLEAQFTPEMNWDNVGTVWEVDHIYPISRVDYNSEVQCRAVCHHRNLRPLTCEANRAKANKITDSATKLFKELCLEIEIVMKGEASR